ncbi:hypothetical protein KIP88_26475 [Bradyrhizobium sp. SRL28]|uniref:hypothetical protein n=1 Tax=Bradyrhizobium sp. SRL28 TaxID=2836178 RepID=UPI001BDF63D5|nr:hypothetical protein [Bradyrhizobium sp. SRL28]MBT1514046.1 hypothetical protein [Bradyrhizobium sp. SRL28]
MLALLFAADSLLPAPLPSKLIESHSTLPPIRITSELKGPEAVVINTSQPGFLPILPDKEIAAARRRRSALMWPMLYDSRPLHCPSKPQKYLTSMKQAVRDVERRWSAAIRAAG